MSEKSMLDPERKFIKTPINAGERYYCVECAKCRYLIPILRDSNNTLSSIIDAGAGLLVPCPECRHEQIYSVEDVHTHLF